MSRDLSRARQRYVYERVRGWKGGLLGRATQLAQGLPVEVRGQGLTSALALLSSKRGGEHNELADLLAGWLLEDGALPAAPIREHDEKRGSRVGRLLAACVKADRGAYLAAQAEALALLNEVKVLSKAVAATAEQRTPEAPRSASHG